MNRTTENRFNPGETIGDWIEGLEVHLKDDGVGLHSMISDASYYFGLSGEDQNEFIRQCIVSVSRMGGRPKLFDHGAKRWVVVTRYGDNAEDIARNVVQEWVAQGRPDIAFYDGLRFLLPEK